jgi:hypothetical protein
MGRISEIDQACEQPNEGENIDTVADTKTVQDMFKILFEKMSENNQHLQINLEKKLSDVQVNLERKISENNKELKTFFSEEIGARNERIMKTFERDNQKLPKEVSEKVESNENCEKLADDVDGEVNNMIPKVQAKDNCTEETLKR